MEIEEEIFLAAVGQGVLIGRGSWFTAEREDFVQENMFFRATFAGKHNLVHPSLPNFPGNKTFKTMYF